MNRRDFARIVVGASVLGLVDTTLVARALPQGAKRLSRLANRSAGPEGAWPLTRVDGRIPAELNGTLYRVCPGQRENHGVALRHLFDGDAFVAAYRFRDGKASLRAKYVATPERVEELEAGKMLYDEFGTPAPGSSDGKRRGGKNQPSVNIVSWDGVMLGLSEGGHPTAIDPTTLDYRGRWDFHGTLPADVPFTAHPRFDPATGVGYGYGVRQGMNTALVVFRMERDGRLTKLYDLPQPGYFIIHDMLLTPEHVVFLIPPARFDFAMLFSGRARVAADAVKFYEKEPMRILLLRRDGTGRPITIEQPTGMLFHNGNAFERDGKIVLETILSPSGSFLEQVYAFASGKDVEPAGQRLVRLVVDPAAGRVASQTVLDDREVEFPRYDLRRTGGASRYLYTLGFEDHEDTLAANVVLRFDLERSRTDRIAAGRGRVFGEAVFVPRGGAAENEGWLMVQGYDAAGDENFLEIRDAGTLELAARLWSGIHAPLGFHGNFVQAV
jgi:all-trans-8'-apo-beta-carotenal 15,15'-oxygenase